MLLGGTGVVGSLWVSLSQLFWHVVQGWMLKAGIILHGREILREKAGKMKAGREETADTDQTANLWPELQGFVSYIKCCLEE